MSDLIAYNNDPALKAEVMERVKRHRDFDEMAQGYYYEEKNGAVRCCAVGCVLEQPNGNHEEYENYGIPENIAYIEEDIFEAMPTSEAKNWPYRFMNAIIPGTDLGSVAEMHQSWERSWRSTHWPSGPAPRTSARKLIELVEEAPCANGMREIEA